METTINDFLGGQLAIEQPLKGYRAGIDPVILAASVEARAGQSVLDLGAGVGTALLTLMRRVQGINGMGVEIQVPLTQISKRNAKRNGISAAFFVADIEALPDEIRHTSFDHVLVNPPFFDRSRSVKAHDEGKETGRGQDKALCIWVDVALRRLRPKGYAHFILKPPQIPEILGHVETRRVAVKLWPIVARSGQAANLALVQLRKDSAAPFELLSPLIVHHGPAHICDKCKDYTPQMEQVLRKGAQLIWSKE